MASSSPTPKTVNATAPTSFGKAPDEIVLKILSTVPYSRAQHASLRLVSQRFRDLIDSNDLRLKVLKYQYPTLVALRNPVTVSQQDLLEYAKQELKVQITVCKIYNGDDTTTKAVIVDGVHLLDHIMTVLNNQALSERKKMRSIEYVRSNLGPLHAWLLRYVLKLVFESSYVSHFSEIELGTFHPLYYMETSSYQQATGAEPYILMLRRRAFETAFLLNDTHNLTDFVLSDHRKQWQKCGNPLCGDKHFKTFDICGERMCTEYRALLAAYDHAQSVHRGIHNDRDHKLHLQKTKSFNWRMLSFKECHCGDQVPSDVGGEHHEFLKEFMTELHHDDDFSKHLEAMAASSALDANTLTIFKAIGPTLEDMVANTSKMVDGWLVKKFQETLGRT
ncbi:hypothetical protein PMZ80_002863 [Knufia obscura]|uniref:F-box domain-containing protein n=1 Tax=Knufia obscura TaxID=1635080 RepID=A0ABR0RYH9_9EURO|nr:hypothetical protein PMZ80_002863 [Knufia obscura]